MMPMPPPGAAAGTLHASQWGMADDDIEKDDPTNAGYDEAAHSGPSQFGVPEGEGGVFGTTGGGTSEVGFHVDDGERPSRPQSPRVPRDDT
jgi:hypothetical protein